MFPFLGALAGAGASLLGNVLGQQNQASINQANINATQLQNAVNFQNSEAVRGQEDARQDKWNQTTLDTAKEYAQNSVQWHTSDVDAAAAASGINRLSLLGVPSISAPSVSAGSYIAPPPGQVSEAKAFKGDYSDIGQNISRAITALDSEAMRGKQLENDLLASKIRNTDADTANTLGGAAARLAPGTPPGRKADPNEGQMYITVFGRRGEPIEIPNPKYATSLQTPASWPQQAAMALKAPFEMASDAYKYYSGVGRNMSAPQVPPWVYRTLSTQQYGSFPWN
ncbi:DNA pilot protein [robinz microvirus RP_39]|nr:DNA pilot protein [robinz microvirus RP_39]